MKIAIQFMMMLVVAASIWGCAKTPEKEPLQVDRLNAVSVTATVEAVDLKNRMVTLRNYEGKEFTIHAGEEVVNLPQVQVGDEVVAVYVNALSVRMAESGEVWDENISGVATAEKGDKPGVIGVSETTITATIEAIDKTLQTASLRMPDGNLQVVPVEVPENLEKVDVGDRIVITTSAAIDISVQKSSN